MDELILLTDGSVNTQSKIGYGAYLLVSNFELISNASSAAGGKTSTSKPDVKLKRFTDTSSTKLELQTLLWSLGEIPGKGKKITVYTDSQNIIGLLGRRERFEKNNYRSKKNRLLNNHELYQEFFKVTDQLMIEFVKVKGHKVSKEKNDIDRLFTFVDKASRNAVRNDKP